jgi:glycosyltransferase involved in cell wall biosynthesis
MTRVVIIANNIEELGGAQRIGHVLANGLQSRGYAVDLVGLVPKDPVHHYAGDVSSRTLLDEPLAPKRDQVTRERQRKRICDALRTTLAEGEPGVVITVQVWAMEHLREVDSSGWRRIGQYHSSYEAAVQSGDIRRLEAEYRAADWFTVLTEDDRRHFARHDFNNLIVMANPIDPWPAEPADLSAHTITVLGRLSHEKGPDIALDAWAQIADAHPQWTLQFVGDGPLAHLIADSGLPRVQHVPTTRDPLRTLHESGMLCLPSRIEGMPLALMEAMASGLPVVATNCSAGVRELVDNCGVLVPPGDPGALAQGLEGLLNDGHYRADLGRRARQRMAAYQPAPVLDRWEWLLTQTLR